MKSLLMIVLLSIGLNSAQASTQVLECSFPSLSSDGKIMISVNQLDRPQNISLNYDLFTGFDDESAAFAFNGEELEWLWYLMISPDGQGVRLDQKGNLVFFLDSDGCDTGKLYLYGNSGFRKGYLSVDHNCSGPDRKRTYSVVNCRLN